jgi:hypothetical protein
LRRKSLHHNREPHPFNRNDPGKTIDGWENAYLV